MLETVMRLDYAGQDNAENILEDQSDEFVKKNQTSHLNTANVDLFAGNLNKHDFGNGSPVSAFLRDLSRRKRLKLVAQDSHFGHTVTAKLK